MRIALAIVLAGFLLALSGCPTTSQASDKSPVNVDLGSEARAKAVRNFDGPSDKIPGGENAKSTAVYGPDYSEQAGADAEAGALSDLPSLPGK
ncbi:MAG: hypothetical protein ACYS22_12500 [Planctomycetota bacterium]|jgi:hypothetical protein